VNILTAVLRWLGPALVLIAVVLGVRIVYEINTETRLHKRVGVVPLPLDRAGAWTDTTFRLFQPGMHILYLTSVNAFSQPYEDIDFEAERQLFSGAFEAVITSPGGETFLEKRYDGSTVSHPRPYNTEWTVLEELQVADPFQGEWTIRARVVEADTMFGGIRSELLIFPPQKYEIGWFLFEKSVELALVGLLFFVGMVAVGAGALLRRRARRRSEP
jgi:hypothetical protein